MLLSYFRLIPFVIGLLTGIQGPAFVDQYAKTISAHLSEARLNFSEFKNIAETYFEGDVEALILHHRSSEDPIFRDEAEAVEKNHRRISMLETEMAAVSGFRPQALIHIFFQGDRDLFSEVRTEYSYVIPLNEEAVVWGLSIGFFCAFIIETLMLLIGKFSRIGPKRKTT